MSKSLEAQFAWRLILGSCLLALLAVEVPGATGHVHEEDVGGHVYKAHDHGHGQAHHHHGHDHDHDHDHDHEPASFKYSKQANQVPATQQPNVVKKPATPPKPAAHSRGHDHGHGHGHSHGHAHSHGHGQTKSKLTTTSGGNVWLYAMGSTLAISLAPFVILFLIPISSNAPEHEPLLRVLLAFASGGLLGDAFLHLIPHAIPHSHGGGDDHAHGEHDHMIHTVVGMWVLAGIITFLIVEKTIRHIKGGHNHSHAHSPSSEPPNIPKEKPVEELKSSSDETEPETSIKNDDDVDYELVRNKRKKEKEAEESRAAKKAEKEKAVVKAEEDHHEEDSSGDIRVSGYLNLAADFAHNFTDGLAIGASFLAGQSIGIVTTVTILFHEIPHEIGDFALLVQSGCSKKKAMALQLVTALGAFSGCLLSLMLGSGDELEGKVSWVLPFTAGGFIYIATVSVIPELLQDSKISQTIKEIAALLTGIGMMVIIAFIEESQHQH